MRSHLARWWFLLLIPVVVLGGVLLPDTTPLTTGGSSRDGTTLRIEPATPIVGQPFTVYVRDTEPLPHILLTVNDEPIAWQQEPTQDADGWEWQWTVTLTRPLEEAAFYYNCDAGCLIRTEHHWGASTESTSTTPTKLGVVFANPERDWHGRSGWQVELSYSDLGDTDYWGVNDLAQRVALAERKGIRVLIRVDYQQGQSIPPLGDAVALDGYLRHLQRLARDARLQSVYGYIIGSGYNSLGNNSNNVDTAVTPAWYARVLAGYGEDLTHTDNVIQEIRAVNPTVQILVGPVQPWNLDQNGIRPYTKDVPWLNYFNTLVALLDASQRIKAEAGIPFVVPDGFALQAPGRVNAPELEGRNPAAEPATSLTRTEWDGAEAGFRVYQDWLEIINQYPTLQGKPAYITSTNTYTPDDPTPPAQTYPRGWLTTALGVVNAEPQIRALIWFVDADGSGASNWDLFSLSRRSGRLLDADEEFDALLGTEGQR